MFILKNKTQGNFTMISNRILADKELTLKDRGLLCTLFSYPDNWNFSIQGLTTLIPDGINAAESMPVPTIRGWSGSPASDRHDAAKEKARRMMVLNTNNSLEIPVIDGVTLTGIGIVDGSLHIQIRYADIHHTDNHGFLTLSDKSGNSYEEGLRKQEVGSVSWFGENHDSWEEYIFDEYPEDLSQIGAFIKHYPIAVLYQRCRW